MLPLVLWETHTQHTTPRQATPRHTTHVTATCPIPQRPTYIMGIQKVSIYQEGPSAQTPQKGGPSCRLDPNFSTFRKNRMQPLNPDMLAPFGIEACSGGRQKKAAPRFYRCASLIGASANFLWGPSGCVFVGNYPPPTFYWWLGECVQCHLFLAVDVDDSNWLSFQQGTS